MIQHCLKKGFFFVLTRKPALACLLATQTGMANAHKLGRFDCQRQIGMPSAHMLTCRTDRDGKRLINEEDLIVSGLFATDNNISWDQRMAIKVWPVPAFFFAAQIGMESPQTLTCCTDRDGECLINEGDLIINGIL